MSLNEEEKYFVFQVCDSPKFEPVMWFKTLKQVQKEAKAWKKWWPEDAPDVYIGKVLFEKTKEV